MAEGARSHGLYKLQAAFLPSTSLPKSTSCTAHTIDTHLIHARFGHISCTKLAHFPAMKDINHQLICDTCNISKFHRLPFVSNHNRSNAAFDLIHIDIWGPYKHQASNGSSFFLTIVDDHTRCTWTYLIANKSHVPHILQTFYHYILNQFHTSIKAIRSDNGSEFLGKDCISFFQQCGITHQLSMVYTPQQNGVVKRKHRHILETARALKLHVNLPGFLWGECILAATYLINRMPTPVLDWKSPLEVLFNKIPPIDHLRTIGCLCYAAILGPSKTSDKFAPRAHKCILLGYPPQQKEYKLLNLDTNQVFNSRDVLFHEHIFPFKDSAPPLDTYTPSFPSFHFPKATISLTSNQPAVETTHHDPSPTGNISIPIRKSQRTKQVPTWFNDFIIPSKHTAAFAHSLSMHHNPLSSCHNDHIAFLANLFTVQEPFGYHQASQDPLWIATMEKEL